MTLKDYYLRSFSKKLSNNVIVIIKEIKVNTETRLQIILMFNRHKIVVELSQSPNKFEQISV